jgi:hypothetical protein
VIYNDAFVKGKFYSFEFGKILGKIDSFISLAHELKFLSEEVNEEDIRELNKIRSEAEEYQKELSEEITQKINERVNCILIKYIT